MGKKNLHLLLVNPWIFDFAAHDLWAKPLGLLLLGGLLRTRGYEVRLVDCLDVHEVRMEGITGIKPATRGMYCIGKFFRTQLPKPPALICGLPGRDPAEVAHSIRVVRDHGARPYLAEFSPIPGTALWAEAVRSSPFDLETEPLYHNNSILPCRSQGIGPEDLQWLKNLCRKNQA